jgi:hypothetical protein
MGFRFQKRIRIFKGLTLNLNKSGSSLTVGRQGVSVSRGGEKSPAISGHPAPVCPPLAHRRGTLCGHRITRQPPSPVRARRWCCGGFEAGGPTFHADERPKKTPLAEPTH